MVFWKRCVRLLYRFEALSVMKHSRGIDYRRILLIVDITNTPVTMVRLWSVLKISPSDKDEQK
jgi:hypothetical protein